MASYRPGYTRTSTDRHGQQDIELEETAKPGDSEGTYDSPVPDVKEGAYIDVQPSREDDSPPSYEIDADGFHRVTEPVSSAKDLVTQVLHVEDDPTLSPYTFRVVFLGEFMAAVIPRRGFFCYLNPGPFNQKEHAAITIMASAASQSALSTEALAAQQLFYGGYPSRAAGVFITLSSQLIGYGIAGMLRDVLVYPTRLLWPINLPVATLLETLHRDKDETKRRLRVFYIIFICIFVWEAFPEYMFTVLTGVSIFCLADQHSLVFTNLFGGASGNEGLGFLSICFDWNYIAGLYSPMWYPLQTLFNQMLGIIGCYILFMGIYYGNLWRSLDFPFLSQEMFSGDSNSTNFIVWDQSVVLNDRFEIDHSKLDQVGIPYLTGTYIGYLITSNMGLTATFTHMLLWNWNDVKAGWLWASPTNFRKLFRASTWQSWKHQETPEQRMARKQNDPSLDPHYKLMLRNLYKETPMWWWGAIVLVSWVVGIACLYAMQVRLSSRLFHDPLIVQPTDHSQSTLPWWGFLLSTILTFVFMLFFGTQMGITDAGWISFSWSPIGELLLHLLHLQCSTDGRAVSQRSQAGPVHSSATSSHISVADQWLHSRRDHELGHDVFGKLNDNTFYDILIFRLTPLPMHQDCRKPRSDPHVHTGHQHMVRTKYPAVQHACHCVEHCGFNVLRW
nr:oligopeptide transporter 4 [Quercus suber]